MILPYTTYYYKQQILSEGWFQTIVARIKEKLSSVFAKLNFGEAESISIPVALSEKVTPVPVGADVRAFVGYYAEAMTARSLAQQIKRAGGRLGENSAPEYFSSVVRSRLSKVKAANAPASEIIRADAAAHALGLQIWTDIEELATDFVFLTFNITLSGDSEKGKSKADIILRVTKDTPEKAILTVAASLKVYKTAQINLANTSFISLIKKLFYDVNHPIQARNVTTEEFITQLVGDYGESTRPLLKKLWSWQTLISREMGRGKTKAQARKLAKLSHPQVISLILKIFNEHYRAKYKTKINARFLKLLGFGDTEDFYAAIGSRGVPRVLSSRSSQEFQSLLKAFRSSFTISLERNPGTNNIRVIVYDNRNTELLHGTITFADSGGKSAAGKTNFFINFKPFLS